MFNLSVIIPIFNEENISRTVIIVHDYLSKCKEIDEFQIVLVNDGSTDNTLEKCERLRKIFSNICLVAYEENHGKGYAFNKGVRVADKDLIMFMDADLSVGIEELPRFLEASKDYDAVIASRNLETSYVNYEGSHRKTLHSLSSNFIRKFINLPFTDSQCGFKLFHKNVVKQFINLQEIYRFAFDVELLQFIVLRNYSVKELGVRWDSGSNSSVRPFKDSFRFLVDLVKIKNKFHKEIRRESVLVERRT